MGGDIKDWVKVGVPKEWDAKRLHDELSAVIKSARVFDLADEPEPEPEPIPVPMPEPVSMPDWEPAGLSPGPKSAYQWSPEQLAAIAAMNEAIRNPPPPPTRAGRRMERMERARLWLQKRDPAVKDQGGDRHTFETIFAVMKTFGLGENQLMEVLADWNQACLPPWDHDDLRAKVRSTVKLYGK
jgi:hypothetical protein